MDADQPESFVAHVPVPSQEEVSTVVALCIVILYMSLYVINETSVGYDFAVSLFHSFRLKICLSEEKRG